MKPGQYVGSLCKRGHDHEGTGGSLRYKDKECVECKRLRGKKYREENPGYNKKYYEENQEAIVVQRAGYYEANRSITIARVQKYYRENQEAIAQRSKTYREKNRERISQYRKKYYKVNKDTLDVQKKKYNKENKDAIALQTKGYREENKEAIAAYQKKNRDTLGDTYIKHKIVRNTALTSVSEVTPEMIEIMREVLTDYRCKKEIKNGTTGNRNQRIKNNVSQRTSNKTRK